MYLPTSHPWAEDETLGAYLEKRGVSRRDFLSFSAKMSAVLGLSDLMTFRVADALAAVKRPSVVWISVAGYRVYRVGAAHRRADHR
jgi:hypothetical protein